MLKVLFLVTLSIVALPSAQISRAFAARPTDAEHSSSLLLLINTASKFSPYIASSTKRPTGASTTGKASVTKSSRSSTVSSASSSMSSNSPITSSTSSSTSRQSSSISGTSSSRTDITSSKTSTSSTISITSSSISSFSHSQTSTSSSTSTYSSSTSTTSSSTIRVTPPPPPPITIKPTYTVRKHHTHDSSVAGGFFKLGLDGGGELTFKNLFKDIKFTIPDGELDEVEPGPEGKPSTTSKSTTRQTTSTSSSQCPVTTAYDYWVECASTTASGQTMSCITTSSSLTTGCSNIATIVTSIVAPACLYGKYSGDENGEDGGCPANIPCDQYFCSSAAVSSTGSASNVCQYAFYSYTCTFGLTVSTSTSSKTSSATSSSCSSSPLPIPTNLSPASQVLYAISPCYAILEFIYSADQLRFIQAPDGMSVETIQTGNEIVAYIVGSTTSSDGSNNYVISVSPIMFTMWAGASGVIATATITATPGPSDL